MQRLGMAEEKISAIHEIAGKFPHESFLGFFIEIDDDVAAKNDIDFFGQAKFIIHEV